jgi:class 3 adenylate cyclase
MRKFIVLSFLFLCCICFASKAQEAEAWVIAKDNALAKGDKKEAAKIVFDFAFSQIDNPEESERLIFYLRSAEEWSEQAAQNELNGKINYLLALFELRAGRYNEALAAADKAEKMFDATGDDFGIGNTLTLKGQIFEAAEKPERAVGELVKLFEFLGKCENYEQQKKVALKVSELYDLLEKPNLAALFRFYAKNLANPHENRSYYDSAFMTALVYDNVQLREQYRLRLSLISIVSAGLLFLMFWFLIKNFRAANKKLLRKNSTIKSQQQQVEELLAGILPHAVALELKENGNATPRYYESVTILFADLKGFTYYAERATPEKLIEDLNYCFTAFDNIVTKHGLEKIKTIGDAYMCAGGVPTANETHAFDTVEAAIEMQDFVKAWKKEREERNEEFFELKIGINTGPVIAGVVGTSKFAYDIWGDAVNLAARVESVCVPGYINISEETYKIIAEKFDCLHRGKVPVKNKGEVDMYYVAGKKTKGE